MLCFKCTNLSGHYFLAVGNVVMCAYSIVLYSFSTAVVSWQKKHDVFLSNRSQNKSTFHCALKAWHLDPAVCSSFVLSWCDGCCTGN